MASWYAIAAVPGNCAISKRASSFHVVLGYFSNNRSIVARH
jgi:hypothetical protein